MVCGIVLKCSFLSHPLFSAISHHTLQLYHKMFFHPHIDTFIEHLSHTISSLHMDLIPTFICLPSDNSHQNWAMIACIARLHKFQPTHSFV